MQIILLTFNTVVKYKVYIDVFEIFGLVIFNFENVTTVTVVSTVFAIIFSQL